MPTDEEYSRSGMLLCLSRSRGIYPSELLCSKVMLLGADAEQLTNLCILGPSSIFLLITFFLCPTTTLVKTELTCRVQGKIPPAGFIAEVTSLSSQSIKWDLSLPAKKCIFLKYAMKFT